MGIWKKARKLDKLWGPALCPSFYLHLRSRAHVFTQAPGGRLESLCIWERSLTLTVCVVHILAIVHSDAWSSGSFYPASSVLGVNVEMALWIDLELLHEKLFKQFRRKILNITAYLGEEFDRATVYLQLDI